MFDDEKVNQIAKLLINITDRIGMMATMGFLDIDQVNQMTGLPQATLRNWEKRYGFPRPDRTAGGHRIYSMDEVRRIRQVVKLCEGGMKLKEAIEKALTLEASEEVKYRPTLAPSASPLSEEVGEILQSLYRYDEVAAEKSMSRVGTRLSELDLLQMIYSRCLYQVGSDWESGRINIAQEHFAWNFFRTRLLNYFKTSQVTGEQLKFVLATPVGQLHEGGLIVLAAFMMLKGWRVYYLGVNLPFEDLRHAVNTIKPEGVCLSALECQSVLKHWSEWANLGCPVFLGGPCVSEIKEKSGVASKFVHLMEGSLSSAVENIELVVRSK